ncbi:HD domain-containing phosphohydrolase, partial [Calidithermus terrae]|uniref:HD domain-containing phosphohydrolase n=1 Tax=Calidithermus terrae TaxID=1408545 RepID=UPI000E657CC6
FTAQQGYGGLLLLPLPARHGPAGAVGLLFRGGPPPDAQGAVAAAAVLARLLEATPRDVGEEQHLLALEALASVPPGDLQGLAAALARSLGARMALVGRLIDAEHVEAFAVHGGEPFVYSLAGTPCADVLRGGFCEHADGVARCFPEDLFLQDWGAEAYLGRPLRARSGRVLGLLVALHDAPLPAGEAPYRQRLFEAYARRAESELEYLNQTARLEAASRAYRLLRPAQSAGEVHRLVVEAALRETGASTANLFLYDEAHDGLELAVSLGEGVPQSPRPRLPRGQGPAWGVFELGQTVYVPDASQDRRAGFTADQRAPAAYLGVPLSDHTGRVHGVLSLDTAATGENFNQEDRFFVEALAEAAGAAIARLNALELARSEARRFQQLARFSAQLSRTPDPEAAIRHALQTLLDLTGMETGLFAALDGALTPMIWAGRYSAKLPRLAKTYPFGSGKGLMEQALVRGEIVHVADYATFPGALPVFLKSGLKSAVAIPLRPRGQAYGVLALGTSGHTVHLSEELRDLLAGVARQVEGVLERHAFVAELERTREEALRSLGLALEYRDLETAGHTDRVTALALRLGERLGLGEAELANLRWGAYLHDLGKLAIPDAILQKPGKLTPEEWERMKAHATLGELMARQLGFLPAPTLGVIRHHHERWDGTGYPDGLKGEAIPLLARLFALADVYDALTSARPYKQPWSREAALAEIRVQAGRQFDPEIVRVFLATFEDSSR